ncbi:hypothetical protein HRbin36_01330 [bacterium HR36]|nr:hypothetical protein HRbin36_01330 [bacterium HR36]
MVHRLAIALDFQLQSPVHITGESAELYTDKALLLDWQGEHALIPATSLKGWLRDNIERALRGMKISVCDSSQAELLCGQCIVCQLFGHPHRRALLRFSDIQLTEDIRDIRMNVSLSRYRRASFEERLFSTELAWLPKFSCSIDALMDDAQLARTAAALVYLGARTGFALGAARSRGLGWVTLTGYQASIDGTALNPEDLHPHLKNLTAATQEITP